MRLGINASCYHWLAAAPDSLFWADRDSAKYDWKGFPKPYFLSTPNNIPPDQFFEFLVQRCIDLDVQVVHSQPSLWEPDYIRRMKDLMASRNLEMIPQICADLVGWQPRTASEVDKAVGMLQRYQEFDNVKIVKICMDPMVHNRFRNDPPLKEQLESITENIKPVVKVAEKAGIPLAFENHLDYRAKEVVQIIEGVNSPYLRFLFDGLNAFAVCEDPVEAAEIAAPYTIVVHLNDVRVVPWSPSSLGYFACMFVAPLGQGNVDNDRIIEIFQQKAPDPKNLSLVLELSNVPPTDDSDKWVVEGIKYAKARWAKYLR